MENTREYGVLEQLRAFKNDKSAAEAFAADTLKIARQLEPALKAFEYLPSQSHASGHGPLNGIPVAIKDVIATSDAPTTNGSPIYAGHVPDTDAWVVDRLRNLGATIFGKTVSTEFAWRQPGPTVNPWNPKHTPGGSSSGSAASVAAGIVPLALGTQTLGSVVRPAAFNGVVGYKPSFGAIPRSGVHALSPSLDHVGFFARRVDDVAYALSLLAATSDADIHGRPLPPFEVSAEQGLAPSKPPRIAVARMALWSRAEADQKKIFDDAVAKLKSAGAIVEDVVFGDLDKSAWDTCLTVLSSEASVIYAGYIERHPDKISEHLKSLVKTGKSHSAYDYLTAKHRQSVYRQAVEAQISDFDVILTLPAFGEAPEGLAYTGDAEYCAPWTLLGVPAVSMPAGFGKRGLPLGIQLAGKYRQDLHTLSVAKWIEDTLAFRPGLAPLATQ
ncbi:MAG: amidase [Bradyrhizobiaceae bacterium]|nr:MAG: amidase [Bradyrhizobiaceae bacterium]